MSFTLDDTKLADEGSKLLRAKPNAESAKLLRAVALCNTSRVYKSFYSEPTFGSTRARVNLVLRDANADPLVNHVILAASLLQTKSEHKKGQ